MSETPRADPIAVARALQARLDLRAPREILVELIAYEAGACVLWRDAGSADARVVRSGPRAYLSIAKEARGTPRARFSIAHELGHHLLHHDYDAIERIHGAPRLSGRDFLVEDDANRFAAELLVPTSLAAPMCVAAPPTLDEVAKLARTFDVSLSVAAQRWAQMASLPCAFVESKGGVIRRAIRSSAFRGVARQRRKLEEGTLTLDVARTRRGEGTRMHATAWGSAAAEREILEECVPLTEDGAVLTWLWHA